MRSVRIVAVDGSLAVCWHDVHLPYTFPWQACLASHCEKVERCLACNAFRVPTFRWNPNLSKAIKCAHYTVDATVLGSEVCRLTVDWIDCRCFLAFVFLGGARRLELSSCNTVDAWLCSRTAGQTLNTRRVHEPVRIDLSNHDIRTAHL